MLELARQNIEETIEEKTCLVRQQLRVLINHLEDNGGIKGVSEQEVSSRSITDVLERFLLWAGNLGAFHKPMSKLSLDHRLLNRSDIRRGILRQLNEILEAANELTNIVLGTRVDRVAAAYVDAEGREIEPLNESLIILRVISIAVSALFRIGILVRKAMPYDRFERALRASDLDFSPDFDVNYVEEKHPKIPKSWLSNRLGSAITKRRQFIRYCRDHKSHLEAENTERESRALTAENTSSKATTFVPQVYADLCQAEEAEVEDVLSIASASTVTNSTGALRLPSLEDLSPEGDTFECPICFTLQSFKEDLAWKKHALKDLKAYVCTFDGGGECNALLFSDRGSWFDHEMIRHRASYTCGLCGNVKMTSRGDIRLHFATHGSFSDDELQALEDDARRVPYHLQASDCPFCDEWADKLRSRVEKLSEHGQATGYNHDPMVSAARFKRHVAVHQEQLALFAIPRAMQEKVGHETDSISDSRSDEQSIANRYSNEEMSQFRPWKCPITTCQFHELGWPSEREMVLHIDEKHPGSPAAKEEPSPEISLEPQGSLRDPTSKDSIAAQDAVSRFSDDQETEGMTEGVEHPKLEPEEVEVSRSEGAEFGVAFVSRSRSTGRLQQGITECPEGCGKTFSRVRDLNKHLKQHRPPLQCEADPQCNAQKTERRDMERHYRTAHQEYAKWLGISMEDEKCDICGAGFTRRDNLLRHKRREHNIGGP